MKSRYYMPNELESIGSSPYLKGFVSLCTGGGVGDIGIEQSSTGLRLAVAVENHRQRARLLQGNFPRARVIQGDIEKRTVKAQVCEAVKEAFDSSRPFAVLMTPPCQGWSPNGQGRLRRNAAWEPESDTRNLVVTHCLEITAKILPAMVVFENVPHMRSKEIRLRKRTIKVVNYIRERLERIGYTVHQSPGGMIAANYGIPQERNRVFIIAERIGLPEGLVFPKPSHVNPKVTTDKCDLPHWITLGEVIGPDSARGDVLLKRLTGTGAEGRQDLDDDLHRIPPVNHNHLAWIRNVPPGGTAFDNSECPKCHYDDPEYDWRLDAICSKCGSTLNKPVVLEEGGPRVIKGRRTSYRRMRWDKAAPTVTCSSGTLSSDNKIHPTENRVLSIREVMILQTMDNYNYSFETFMDTYRGESVPEYVDKNFMPSDTFIRTIIGEAIPPKWLQIIFEHIWTIDKDYREMNGESMQHVRKDMFSREKRSRIMSSIRSKNTGFERRFRSVLWKSGMRGYRTHWKPAGSADVAWPGMKVAVFLDSDFWHGWDWVNLRPKLKNDFWVNKIKKTMERDIATTKRLERGGWTVLRFWGHEITANPEGCAEKIAAVVRTTRLLTAPEAQGQLS